METIGEIIPFAKEMLNQRPSRHTLKIYMLGSTLAMLGVVGGLVETVLLPFVEQEETYEEKITGLTLEDKKKEKKEDEKKQTLKPHPPFAQAGDEDNLKTGRMEDRTKHLTPHESRGAVIRLYS
ncbi:G0/G1 switch protein 2 [Xyrichtys novacula]|uniref:G0/G1 switch protein 2 n=1 Tax=Xyrichtys novacula TaxID=13765 RepID=A0AAV1HEB2_XYRNO|nr:G0/G1 switch protein 2 [Xyrichtys novacula]